MTAAAVGPVRRPSRDRSCQEEKFWTAEKQCKSQYVIGWVGSSGFYRAPFMSSRVPPVSFWEVVVDQTTICPVRQGLRPEGSHLLSQVLTNLMSPCDFPRCMQIRVDSRAAEKSTCEFPARKRIARVIGPHAEMNESGGGWERNSGKN